MAGTSGSWGMLLVLIAVLCAAAFFGGMRFQQRRRGDQFDAQSESAILDTGRGRLEVVEITSVADGRRLALIRCDDLEHLVMLGGQSDLLIHANMQTSRAPHSEERAASLGSSRNGALRAQKLAAQPLAVPTHPVERTFSEAMSPDIGSPAAPNGAGLHGDAAASLSAAPGSPAIPVLPVQPDLGSLPELTSGSRAGTHPSPRELGTDGLPSVPPRPAPRRPFFAAFAGRSKVTVTPAQDGAPELREPDVPGEPPRHARAAAPLSGAVSRRGEGSRAALAAIPVAASAASPPLSGEVSRTPRPPSAPAARPDGNAQPALRRQDADRAGEPTQGRTTQRSELPSAGRTPEAPSAAQGHNEETEIIAAAPSRLPGAPGDQTQPTNRGSWLAGPVANGTQPSGLPAAGTPWEGGNGLEDEIERALRSDPRGPASLDTPPLPANRANPAKSENDPGTTLGDLAARLESALAREIVAAQNGAGGLGSEGVEANKVNIDEFAFEPEPAAEMRENTADRADQPAALQPSHPAAPVPPSPPPVAEQPEPRRQEQAPVINLDSRRREPIDPLEDEMARLLGELTGDTNRR